MQISNPNWKTIFRGFRSGTNYDIELKRSFIKGKFKELIIALNKKNKMPVVFLIDEYDKPLIDHLGKGDEALGIAKKNRDIQKEFGIEYEKYDE